MSFVSRFLRFWYNFVIGDDWTVAAAVVVALAVVAILTRVHIIAWWLLPLVVVGILGTSLWRTARS